MPSLFRQDLVSSQIVVAKTASYINSQDAGWRATATDHIKPTPSNPHPADMEVTRGTSTITFEIKRDSKSLQTGNVFFEYKALSEIVAGGVDRVLYWIDSLDTYVVFHSKELMDWLGECKQMRYYKGNAGDAKKFGYKISNPGWAIPASILVNVPTAKLGEEGLLKEILR